MALAAWIPLRAGAQVPVDTLAAELPGAVGGVAVDALGTVYVADFGETVWKITPFGQVEVFADSLYGASGNAVDAEGNLLQASFNGGFVSRIARDGTLTTLARGLQGPVGIALNAAGDAIVCQCQGNSLSRITAQGKVTEFAKSDLFNCPNGITKDASGNFFVVNFSDGRMLKVSPEGQVSEFATIPGGGNGHVAFAGGVFIVTGFRSNRLYQVTPQGEVSVFAGTGAFGEADGSALEAEFSSPNGIAFDAVRRALYVNDYLIPFVARRRVAPKSSLRRLSLPSLTAVFQAAYQEGGLTAATAAYRRFRSTNPGQFTEIETNILGYTLLQQGKVQDAIGVFSLNAEDYPKSFNAWDSLAEGHKAAGQREEAIRFYRKSLELNPANTNAVQMLKELDAEP